MNNLLQTLQTTYQQNPAAALSLLPDLFQAVEDGEVIEIKYPLGTPVTVDCGGEKYTGRIESYQYRVDDKKPLIIIYFYHNGHSYQSHLAREDDFGKSVFLTREATEQALKERDT